MKRVAAVGLGLVALLLALVAVLAGCAWYTLPPTHQTAAIPGLSAPVQISFDQDGVPRLRAANDLDAAAALGFVHARDRLFQMELMRRVGSGRLAEIAGSAGLRIDMLMRTLGLRHRAEADLALLPPHTVALLRAYSRGVNAWIATRGRLAAPEFVVLGTPEPWTPVDSLLWGKTMTLYLSGNYRAELDRLALARRIRPSQIEQLWPAPPTPPAPQAALAPGPARLAAALLGDLPRFPDRFTLPGTASNEWAVDGAHSATGAPLLAGDPHLAFGLPGIWYLARIDTPQGVLAGATAPGVPFLVLGHNAHIAWTFTTTGTDTQDVFVETPVDRDHYATPDGPRAYITRDETIRVMGSADRVLHVRETRHGPVISDIETNNPDGLILAVAMAGLAPADTAPAGLDALDRAGSVAEALAAAPRITSPNQNLLVADHAQIALAVTGRVPIRRDGDGENPVDGASGRFDWTGYASGPQLPQIVAPASGRLVNGNEPVAPPGFPVFMGRDSFGDWRARRIRQLLDAQPRATVDQFVQMQTDATSAFAQAMLPVLGQVRSSTAIGNAALDLLRNWHGKMTRSAPQPLIFNAWMQRFAINLLDGAGVPISQAGPRMEFIAAVLGGTEAGWCVPDCPGALSAALEQSLADLARTQGSNPARWRWGGVHRAVFAHPLLGPVPVIGRLTTRRISTAGDEATVGRAGMADAPVPSFDDVHGASYRGVYDLADLDRSRFMLAPGESGNLFSTHVADFMRRWRDGQTVLLGSTPHHISATLQLFPATAAPAGAPP
jgi:penicillin amidase